MTDHLFTGHYIIKRTRDTKNYVIYSQYAKGIKIVNANADSSLYVI